MHLFNFSFYYERSKVTFAPRNYNQTVGMGGFVCFASVIKSNIFFWDLREILSSTLFI